MCIEHQYCSIWQVKKIMRSKWNRLESIFSLIFKEYTGVQDYKNREIEFWSLLSLVNAWLIFFVEWAHWQWEQLAKEPMLSQMIWILAAINIWSKTVRSMLYKIEWNAGICAQEKQWKKFIKSILDMSPPFRALIISIWIYLSMPFSSWVS